MELKNDYSKWELADALWSGGRNTYDRLSDYWDEIYASLEDMFGDGDSTLTDVNDYLWHEDDDTILENAGVSVVHWDELEDLIDSRSISLAEKTFEKIDKELEGLVEDGEYEDVEDAYESIYGNYEDYTLAKSAVDNIESDVSRIVKNEEKTDDTDSILSAINELSGVDDDFDDIVDMANEIDSWLQDNDVI